MEVIVVFQLELRLENEEIPSSDQILYITQSLAPNQERAIQYENSTIIICVDISGSLNITSLMHKTHFHDSNAFKQL